MRRHKLLIFLFILFVGLFIYRGADYLDPDFGWHIQIGDLMLKHGIFYTDPFSYSMPSYHFVDHEWLTDIFWSLIFNQFGILPLLITLSFLSVASLFLQTAFVEKKWTAIPLILSALTLFEFVGVRAQVITWVFLSLLMYILFQKKLWNKWRFFLPLLFFGWANLHGGFAAGVGVLGIVLLGRSLEERKNIKENILILLLCTIVTLINPFGIRLWWEIWMTLSDTQLRWSISEWYPAYYFTNIAFWIYFTFSVVLVVRYWKKYTLTELFLYFFLLLEGMTSIRNIPLWIIATFMMTVRSISYLSKESSAYLYGSERFRIAYIGFCIIVLCLVLPQFGVYFYEDYISRDGPDPYPTQAIAYLRVHTPKQQIFSSYDWGGYLDWQFAQKKVFIDGRMPSWRWQANTPGESNYALDEYKKVLGEQIPFTIFASKYHITTLLVPKANMEIPESKIFGITFPRNSFIGNFLISQKSFYLVVQEAKKLGWRQVYEDRTSFILQKPGND